MSMTKSVTKESVKKDVLAAHPGATITSTAETQHDGKKAWKVSGKKKDGKEFTAYFDSNSGKMMTEPGRKSK